MQTKDRSAQQQRNELSYLAHDARRIIASYYNPQLRETLIRALCSRLSVGVIGARQMGSAPAVRVE